MYFVIVTLTTLGYGDLVPNSPGGRAVACLLCFSGVLVLALPIAVVGFNFVELYRIYIAKMENIYAITVIDIQRTKVRKTVMSHGVVTLSIKEKMDLVTCQEKFCSAVADKASLVATQVLTYFYLRYPFMYCVDVTDDPPVTPYLPLTSDHFLHSTYH